MLFKDTLPRLLKEIRDFEHKSDLMIVNVKAVRNDYNNPLTSGIEAIK